MMNKASPEYEESMHRYKKAAKLFQGKVSLAWETPFWKFGTCTLEKVAWGEGTEIYKENKYG